MTQVATSVLRKLRHANERQAGPARRGWEWSSRGRETSSSSADGLAAGEVGRSKTRSVGASVVGLRLGLPFGGHPRAVVVDLAGDVPR